MQALPTRNWDTGRDWWLCRVRSLVIDRWYDNRLLPNQNLVVAGAYSNRLVHNLISNLVSTTLDPTNDWSVQGMSQMWKAILAFGTLRRLRIVTYVDDVWCNSISGLRLNDGVSA